MRQPIFDCENEMLKVNYFSALPRSKLSSQLLLQLSVSKVVGAVNVTIGLGGYISYN